jgi:hypothetical protein
LHISTSTTPDMISQFAGQPTERIPLLIAERNQKMAVSAHAHVRAIRRISVNGWKKICPKGLRSGFAAIATLATKVLSLARKAS